MGMVFSFNFVISVGFDYMISFDLFVDFVVVEGDNGIVELFFVKFIFEDDIFGE